MFEPIKSEIPPIAARRLCKFKSAAKGEQSARINRGFLFFSFHRVRTKRKSEISVCDATPPEAEELRKNRLASKEMDRGRDEMFGKNMKRICEDSRFLC